MFFTSLCSKLLVLCVDLWHSCSLRTQSVQSHQYTMVGNSLGEHLFVLNTVKLYAIWLGIERILIFLVA